MSFPCQNYAISKILSSLELLSVAYSVCLSARALGIKDGPISINITDIEKLDVFQTLRSALTDIRSYVV